MKIVFLPIKPRYASLILMGEKRWEYRRSIPKQKFGAIAVYSSSPEKKIKAIVDVEKIISDSPEEIWRKTNQHSGIPEKDFFDYFSGADTAYAMKLGTVSPLFEVTSTQLGVRIPQSFLYLTDQQSEILRNHQQFRVFIGGIHGSGKSELCKRITTELPGFQYVSASSLIKYAGSRNVVRAIKTNQMQLISALASIEDLQPSMLIDGHFALLAQAGAKKIGANIFKMIKPTVACLLISDPEVCSKRISKRDGELIQANRLELQQTAEIENAIKISNTLHVPLIVSNSADEIYRRLSEMIALMRNSCF